jgi:hypothetical protein
MRLGCGRFKQIGDYGQGWPSSTEKNDRSMIGVFRKDWTVPEMEYFVGSDLSKESYRRVRAFGKLNMLTILFLSEVVSQITIKYLGLA